MSKNFEILDSPVEKQSTNTEGYLPHPVVRRFQFTGQDQVAIAALLIAQVGKTGDLNPLIAAVLQPLALQVATQLTERIEKTVNGLIDRGLADLLG